MVGSVSGEHLLHFPHGVLGVQRRRIRYHGPLRSKPEETAGAQEGHPSEQLYPGDGDGDGGMSEGLCSLPGGNDREVVCLCRGDGWDG